MKLFGAVYRSRLNMVLRGSDNKPLVSLPRLAVRDVLHATVRLASGFYQSLLNFFNMHILAMHSAHLPSFFRRIGTILESMLPGSCALCHGDSQHAICTTCSLQFFANIPVRCEICGRRMLHVHAKICGICLRTPPAFDATIVACDYAAPSDMLVQDLKFRSRLPLAQSFGQMLANAIQKQIIDTPDVIIPVPLSEARLAQRGFNQAGEIARSVSRHTNIPLQFQMCVRVRDTQPQARLPIGERRVNMRGAFAVQLNASVRNQHVLLVDDVMTTGHTLNELAACLKRHGAKRVTNAVFARTPEK